jgi:hypothetical protein
MFQSINVPSGEILSIDPDGCVNYDGSSLEQGFIVDNKVFVVDEGGVDSFFNNTGIPRLILSVVLFIDLRSYDIFWDENIPIACYLNLISKLYLTTMFFAQQYDVH